MNDKANTPIANKADSTNKAVDLPKKAGNPSLKNRLTKNLRLTPKERLFIDLYIKSYPECNGTKCAKEAGYSPKTATEIAYELLRKPHIASVVDKELEAKRQKVMLNKEDFMSKVDRLYEETDNINAKVRLLSLEAEILGHNKAKEAQQVNIFQDIGKEARDFLVRKGKVE